MNDTSTKCTKLLQQLTSEYETNEPICWNVSVTIHTNPHRYNNRICPNNGLNQVKNKQFQFDPKFLNNEEVTLYIKEPSDPANLSALKFRNYFLHYSFKLSGSMQQRSFMYCISDKFTFYLDCYLWKIFWIFTHSSESMARTLYNKMYEKTYSLTHASILKRSMPFILQCMCWSLMHIIALLFWAMNTLF